MAPEPPIATPDSTPAEGEPDRPPSGLAPDDLLGDRYRVLQKLGAGGMGEVWAAHDVVADQRVAIKALVIDGRRDHETSAQRLMREAKFVARIDHPNVVRITDFGRTAIGRPYVVMELLHGRPLHELLRRRGPMPWRRVATLGQGIARGLAAAHAIGVIHRDLKPANVFVLDHPKDDGDCKVIDFGIAKATAVDDGDRRLTRTGTVFGTPAYMSPEQARGEAVDARSDIYGLGCILHEALTGRRLFGAKTPAAILYRQLFEAPPAPSTMLAESDIPKGMDAIVLRCLLKDPANRFQRMQDVAEALAGALRGEAIEPPPLEILPVPPVALQMRYGSRAESTTPSGDAVAVDIPATPSFSDPPAPRARKIVHGVAWIVGGAVLGLTLVVGAVFAWRTWARADIPIEARAGTIDDEAPKRLEAWIDDMPRQLDVDEPLEEPEIVVPRTVPTSRRHP